MKGVGFGEALEVRDPPQQQTNPQHAQDEEGSQIFELELSPSPTFEEVDWNAIFDEVELAVDAMGLQTTRNYLNMCLRSIQIPKHRTVEQLFFIETTAQSLAKLLQ